MARIEESVVIKRPVDQVFAYVTNIKNLPQWESAILEAEQTSPGQMGIGTTFRGANRAMGRRMVWTSKVTEYEPNKKWGETISSGSTLIEEHLSFDPVDGGTKFTLVFNIQVGGFLKLFSPMVVSSMRKETKKSLGNLKNILEAQT
jgi:uncharacterized protein YndB with AHSA1/START domain